MDPRKNLVADGYDGLVETFAEWAGRVEGDPRERFLDGMDELVEPGAPVLDLGCGNGLPTTARLAQRHRVTGVDISPRQIAAARANVPGATFIAADIADLELPADSFSAAVALYSIIHVPREEHESLFRRIAGWLVPGGVFVGALGGGLSDGQETWLDGRPMYFSSHPPDVSLNLLRAAGFGILEAERVTIREPDGDATFLWVIARKPGPDPGPESGQLDPGTGT
jgi:SAM-dependent methyltransferase